ncbi:hypothetical protein MMC26_002632 [Xylographa opegraphella]|nr:hypothetical protein [Xylographa opegraphella]
MARTLPWLKGGAKTTISQARVTKRNRTAEPESEVESLPSTTDAATLRRKSAPRADQTPSTSPPPQPPAEEFMREGLERDDIYIMVEDEFHAVAKQFTQHLHHAEYKRLKNLARSRNASAITTISRPTDSITEMRVETKKRKEQESKAAKQKAALAHLKEKAASKRPRTGSDVESDVEDTRTGELWVGTTLHGLMTSPSRKQTSLTGLQGVLSGTRAAAGYSKPERQVSQSKYFDLDRQAGPPRQSTRTVSSIRAVAEAHAADADSTATDEDDDLDMPSMISRSVRKPASSSLRSTTTTTKSPSTSKVATARKHTLPSLPSPLRTRPNSQQATSNSANTTSTPKNNKSVPAHDILDELPRPIGAHSAVSKRIMQRRVDMNTRKLKEATETKGPGSVNEIPIFLV